MMRLNVGIAFAALGTAAASPAAAQIVLGHTLCHAKLPTVAPQRPDVSEQSFKGPGGPIRRPRLSGAGSLRVEAGSAVSAIGLVRIGDGEGDAQEPIQLPIRFGLYFDPKGGVFVREHQVLDARVGDYERGDIFEIVLDGGSARYVKNGETLYVSPSSPRYPIEFTYCGDLSMGARDVVPSNDWSNLRGYNQAPSPVARASRRRVPGKPIRFDASLSSDPEGQIRRVQWDFGDGKRAKGMTVDHIYPNVGSYTVKLQVFDESLEMAETTLNINVEVPPETAVPPAKP